MYYTYILHSEKDNNLYIGYANNLAGRFEQHKKGSVDSTKNRRPLKLVYYEACMTKEDALKAGVWEYLVKPVTKKDLSKTIQRIMDSINIMA